MRPGDGPASDVVLDVERAIGPDASRTHIAFPFVLDREPDGIEITFRYAPKALVDQQRVRELSEAGWRTYGDAGEAGAGAAAAAPPAAPAALNNLLTLSLDGPSGFRGCAHRHYLAGPVVLGRTAATPGFIPGALEAGGWMATVSVHLVVTERCTFTLRVRAL